MIIAALIINLVLIVAVLYLVVKGHLKREVPATASPASPDLAFKEAREIIHNAEEKADDIVSAAEVEGMKLAAESSLGKEVFEKDFSEKIDKSLSSTEQTYAGELDKLVGEHRNFLAQLQQKSQAAEEESENMLKGRVNELLFTLEQNLTGFLNSSEQKSLESINLELKSARALIDTYRTQQLSLIDENIVAVLERTMSLVLKDKIDLKEDLDLVYEALEKAKAEKFFA